NFVDALSRRTYDKDEPDNNEELEVLYDRMTVNSIANYTRLVELNDDEEEDESEDENDMEEWLEDSKIKEWQQEAGFEEIDDEDTEETESSDEETYQTTDKTRKPVKKTKSEQTSDRDTDTSSSISDEEGNSANEDRVLSAVNTYSFGFSDNRVNREFETARIQDIQDKVTDKIDKIQRKRLESRSSVRVMTRAQTRTAASGDNVPQNQNNEDTQVKEVHNDEEHNEDNIEINNNIDEAPEPTPEQETTEPEF